MRPILRAAWSGCALCRYTAEDQVSGQRRRRQRQGRCQNGARPRHPPPFPCGSCAWPGRETPAPRSTRSCPLATDGENVFQESHCGAKSRADPPGIDVAVSCKALVPAPVRNLNFPSCATFTNDRLSCVVGIVCATVWVWMGAQEVINSAANAMMYFIFPFLRIPEFGANEHLFKLVE